MGIITRLFGGRPENTNDFVIPTNTEAKIGLLASPDSTRLAYAVHSGGKMHVEVNGQAARRFDAVSGLTLTNNSLAYIAFRNGRLFVVFNDQDHDTWEDIGKASPTISPNSERIAYTARRGQAWFGIVDGTVVGGPYEGFSPGGILFSPDSNRFAYVIKRADSWVAVVDGQEHNSFPTILQRSLTFSPDSSKVAYVAGMNGRWSNQAFIGEDAVVVDMLPGHSWRRDETYRKNGLSEELTFSPDSNRLAYSGARDGRSFVVVDETVQAEHDGLVSGWGGPVWQKFPEYGKVGMKRGRIVFSPDSRQVAYAAKDGQQHILFLDGRKHAHHDNILNSPLYFSPDSKHLAYGIEKSTKQMMILDDKSMRPYHGLPPANGGFSPDSALFAFAAYDGRADHHILAVGDSTLDLDGGFVIGSAIMWDDAKHLHFLIAINRHVKCLAVVVDSSGCLSIAPQ